MKIIQHTKKMSSTDHFGFSAEKIFKTVCENLEKSDKKTKNLIDCKDDIVFVWDNKNKKLLTQILKVFNKSTSVYQELYPTQSPLTDIQFLRVNDSLSNAVLWGPDGVMIMEIPSRWGTKGFQGGKTVILSRSSIIDARHFILHNIEIRQVRFHPGSPQDNHIVVLTSDNTFRIYEIPKYGIEKIMEPELIRVWELGQFPADKKGWALKGSKVSFLASLGDVAVDFDFGLSILNDKRDSVEELKLENVIWPAIILRGNGDICILNTSLTSNEKPKFEGPLTMYPSADDNYGVEACSILVLSTAPNVIIVATSSGTLYHSLLLETDQNEKSTNSDKNHALFVLECIELELGIQLNDDEVSYSSPIILQKDPVYSWKYYCIHNAGLHAISSSFVWEIEKFLEQKSVENLYLDPSIIDYLVCTRISATEALPVLGFTIFNSSNIMLVMLANGDLMSLQLKSIENLKNLHSLTEEVHIDEETPIKKLLQEPFEIHIKNIFKRHKNQPFIKLDNNTNLSPQESLDLISYTTHLLRNEYFTKFQLVLDETEQRIRILKNLQALHFNQLQQLENEKISLKAMAEKLAEKYEEIKETQQELNQRIEKVVSSVLQLQPIESLAEKKMRNELLTVEENIEYFKKLIMMLKKEMNYQTFKKDEYQSEKPKSFTLGKNQVETIKTSLSKTSQEIADLVKVINAIKKQLNIAGP